MGEKTENTGESEKVYFLVIDYIKELVKKEDVKFGSKIPSERELMSTLGLSRNSIREALRTLENMGLLECRQGQGNFLVNHVGPESGQSLFRAAFYQGKQLCGDQSASEIYRDRRLPSGSEKY